MANLDDLEHVSITDMGVDEALETIRLIRLARRTPTKPPKAVVQKREKVAKAKAATAAVTPDMAAQLLKILGGK